MFKLIKRALLSVLIYAVDIEIDGYTNALNSRIAPDLRLCIEASRTFAKNERARLVSRREATYPIGQRRILDAS